MDNRLILLANIPIRLLVIHYYGMDTSRVQFFEIIIDGSFRKLCQDYLIIKWEIFYCGQYANIFLIINGFMPIIVKAVSVSLFVK